MKKVIIILFLAFMCIAGFGQDSNNLPDVRNVRWGMTKEEVKLKETSEFKGDLNSEMIVFSGVFLNYNCKYVYKFKNNRLNGLIVLFDIKHENTNLFVYDYQIIKNNLIAINGIPYIDEINWTNKQYKNDTNKIGLAISNQDVKFISNWATGRTFIDFSLNGNKNRNISLSIGYEHFENIKSLNRFDTLRVEELISKFSIEKDEFTGNAFYTHKKLLNSPDISVYISKRKFLTPYLILSIRYSGKDWIFIDKYIFLNDGVTLEIIPKNEAEEVIRKAGYGYVSEKIDLEVTPDIYRLLKSVSESDIVKLRYQGENNKYDIEISKKQKEAIKTTLEFYKALGGLL